LHRSNQSQEDRSDFATLSLPMAQIRDQGARYGWKEWERCFDTRLPSHNVERALVPVDVVKFETTYLCGA